MENRSGKYAPGIRGRFQALIMPDLSPINSNWSNKLRANPNLNIGQTA